jgi:tetratricopeptide (TPR) repeat protein
MEIGMSKAPTQHTPAQLKVRRRWQAAIALAVLLLMIGAGLLVHGWRTPPAAPVVNHSYAEALEQAHNGKPGAARVLYQQLSRTDLSDIRRAGLITELANYPSAQALKILDGDLKRPVPLVQQTAIETVISMVSNTQRSVLIGPLLDDPDQSVRFSAVRALLGLTPDDIGLYFGAFQDAAEQYENTLTSQPPSGQSQVQLATLLVNEGKPGKASDAIDLALKLEPDNTDYRYDLAVALHDLQQLEPAQRQLEDILQRQPANRRARTLLIQYWKDAGQLQKVQVLLAELEQLNPDDPALQQGL